MSAKTIQLGKKIIGDGYPAYVIAEIGINHNGDIEIAKKLIDLAARAGCDAVKFQKRTPELCVPEEQKNVMRETPWGYISYLDYRHKMEFGRAQFDEIDRYCKEKKIDWFASCWDEPSVDFMSNYDIPCLKLASCSLTDLELIKHYRTTGLPLIISTGMSTPNEIDRAVNIAGLEKLAIMHCTSTYPCAMEEMNLNMIRTLKQRYQCPIGYSGHEQGLPTTIAALALGSTLIERHITLDHAMWGSDQAASVAPMALIRLMNHIRAVEKAMGDGVKRVYKSEEPIKAKLRRKPKLLKSQMYDAIRKHILDAKKSEEPDRSLTDTPVHSHLEPATAKEP